MHCGVVNHNPLFTDSYRSIFIIFIWITVGFQSTVESTLPGTDCIECFIYFMYLQWNFNSGHPCSCNFFCYSMGILMNSEVYVPQKASAFKRCPLREVSKYYIFNLIRDFFFFCELLIALMSKFIKRFHS